MMNDSQLGIVVANGTVTEMEIDESLCLVLKILCSDSKHEWRVVSCHQGLIMGIYARPRGVFWGYTGWKRFISQEELCGKNCSKSEMTIPFLLQGTH